MIISRDLKMMADRGRSIPGGALVATAIHSSQVPSCSELSVYLTKNGYLWIRCDSEIDSEMVIRLIDSCLGPRQSQHEYEYVAEIYIRPDDESVVRYAGNRLAQPLHNDGAFSSARPRYLLMQCLVKADEGGESLFLDPRFLLSRLGIDDAPLYDDGAFQIFRSNRTAKSEIFYRNRDNVEVHFTSIVSLIKGATVNHEETFMRLLFEVEKPENQTEALLSKHDILLLANSYMLHGRKAFIGDRNLRRIWYA